MSNPRHQINWYIFNVCEISIHVPFKILDIGDLCFVLGNPCRGKFSQLHNCGKQKKETGQNHRENKAFPNSEKQNKHLDETLYMQTLNHIKKSLRNGNFA